MKTEKNLSLRIEKAPQDDSHIAKLYSEDGDLLAADDFRFELDASIFTRLEDCAGKNIRANAEMIRRFGSNLFNNVFHGPVLAAYQRLRDSRIRLKLIVDTMRPDLLRIPWEFMFDGDDFLSANRQMTIARVLESAAGTAKKEVPGKLKTLAIIPALVDLPEHYRPQVDREHSIVRAFVNSPQISDKMELNFLEGATIANLQRLLASEDYHILHFTTHGIYSQKEHKCYVLFEDEWGGSVRVDSETIARLLAGHRSVRLVIFSCYHSVTAIGHRVLGDLPLSLLPRGVPAVIVMQYSVADQSAIKLSARLLNGICRGVPLDHALADARRSVLYAGHEGLVDFGSPILYSDHPDVLLRHFYREIRA